MKNKALMFVMALTFGSNTTVTANDYYNFANCHWPSKSIKLNGKTCGVFKSPQVSCAIPKDVQGKLQDSNSNNSQRASNLFAWQTFIALNWPAKKDHRGVPASHQSISHKGPRVWESYKNTAEIFLPNGAKPNDWNVPRAKVAASCQSNTILYEDIQPTFTNGGLPGTLTAQNHHRTRYDIHYNRTAFEYIVENKLYNTYQQAVTPSVDFPDGSILVKPAWLPLDAAQKQSRGFYTIEACVCDMPSQAGEAPLNCTDKKVGLTGLHVMAKTTSAPQWIWSTFEQVDNVIDTYYNQECSEAKPCAALNEQTAQGIPNQITRLINIPSASPVCSNTWQSVDDVVTLNKDIRRALKKANSKFQHYELIDTQWPIVHPNQPPTVFNVLPALLSNTTLETYIQDTSSCMGCHAMARTQRHDQYTSSDFSFSLARALPTLDDPYLVDTKSLIEAGKMYVNNTYEALPENTTAKLHCTSCHLNDGGNPDASWWVGMDSAYEIVKIKDKKTNTEQTLTYPQSLQHRINGCFTRSMNGKALCQPGADCDNNEPMSAIIAYMKSLTNEANGKFAGKARGFPLIPAHTGDSSQGASIYLQKCAFCHGKEGQGHYGKDATGKSQYYRPALWGKNSFNACAGMTKPTNLAPFIKANMPFEFGGAITVEESWDLALFIDSQCRPGKANCNMPTPNCNEGVEQINKITIK